MSAAQCPMLASFEATLAAGRELLAKEKATLDAFDAAATRRGVMRRLDENLGFVYVMQAGSAGALKIGSTGNPKQRLASIQAANPDPVHIVCLTLGGWLLEMALHKRFAAHRIHGEWFVGHPEIWAFINELKALGAAA